MNKFTLILTALGVFLSLTNVTFASRAKNLVMGTGDGGLYLSPNGSVGTQSGNFGSFFFDDEYNMFYNPAYINDQTDWAIVEKSNFAAAGSGLTAQGGFVAAFLNYRFGMYVNRIAGLASHAGSSNMRPFDFTFGGDMGFQWGLGITYGSYANDAGKDNDLSFRVGMKITEFEPFIFARPIASSKSTGTTRNYTEYGGGLRYKWGEWIPYAAGRRLENNTSYIFGAGIGKSARMSEGLKLHYNLAFWRQTGGNRSIVPFDLAAEATATDWLIIRAGLGYRFLDRSRGISAQDTTSGKVGLTFKLRSIDIDTAVGSNQAIVATTEANSTADAQTFSVGNDSFFTAASLSYRW